MLDLSASYKGFGNNLARNRLAQTAPGFRCPAQATLLPIIITRIPPPPWLRPLSRPRA
jgi:hypothetical protein